MRVGVYVGSFNPPHKGHIKIVNHLLDNNYLDKVVIIPTLNYWNKNNLVDINDRINMLKLYENNKIIIDVKNNDLEYTYLILRKLKEEYKNDEIFLIIGADNIVNFDKWKNYKEILNYNLIILNRSDIDIKFYMDKLNKKNKYVIVKDLDPINISSTMIRECIKDNNKENLLNYLDEKVLNYIEKERLYL